MEESPPKLQNIVIQYVAANLRELCMIKFDEHSGRNKLTFRDSNAVVHQNIANSILQAIDQKGEVDDLVLTLFEPSNLKLSSIKLQKTNNISSYGLKTLKLHNLSSVDFWGLTSISVNDILSCFSEWTFNNIVSLGLHGSLFFTHSRASSEPDALKTREKVCGGFSQHFSNLWTINSNFFKSQMSTSTEDQVSPSDNQTYKKDVKLPVVYIGLCKLQSLKILNLSDTNISSHVLENICSDLQLLSSLDISNCSLIDSISFLKLKKDSLLFLNLYNLNIFTLEETKDTLLSLNKLVYLDISRNKSRSDPLKMLVGSQSIIPELLSHSHFVPNIKCIDISGQEELTPSDLLTFINKHQDLTFLGLMNMLCYEQQILNSLSNCLITGIATLPQLLVSIQRYQRRKEYVPKVLYEIFTLSMDFDTPKPDIIKLILPVMKYHKNEAPIQLAGTACLYNLTKGGLGEGVHPHVLREVVYATLLAMDNFPCYPQLQKNALLTLCCDRILHDVSFDKFWCARLALDCLLTFNDPTTDRMAVAICSILAAKISTSQTALLGAYNVYMVKLFRIIRKRIEEREVDITLKFTLSALWNLTDESPATCEVFLAEKGLQLFMQLLVTFPGESAVETKVLGLLNNIAEVSRLRLDLINKNFIAQLRILLRSDQVEVSYFAAGIVAHLVCAGCDCWKFSGVARETLLNELGEAVTGWEEPKEEMVAYRSFQPFIPLLMALDKPQVQLWAVWALHHVTTKNSSKYCAMLIREGVDDVLRRLVGVPSTDARVSPLVESVLSLLPEEPPS